MISVLLVDDQTLVRSGIRGLLELSVDIRVVAEAVDAASAMQALQQRAYDIMLLDNRMPGETGVELLERMRTQCIAVPAIVLTTFDDDESLLRSLRAGAKGYLLKDISFERLCEAIRQVATGGTMFRPALSERVERSLANERVDHTETRPLEGLEHLTRREIEILALMAGGLSNREIADSLGTSEGTIKNHVSNVLAKLGVRDRVRAVLKAIDRGYL
ncbi:MAG: response regulator transcription factor [Rhodocyclaceae bacterium]|jgi:DNA-binding NarL/FixJ family response regulator|nr:response regulator transcription factor [Rhodocyclaceae bacterium]MCA3021884.1 response regulator transcription factor [Rhodocyclaceae bacterium]MCA3029384.1 response regulator transcription factor [Rhodocyclaceae bacterium]MCA3035499.1 response regulator transcription factor [Rhodocyclaceae bacterium]MCA3051452.1 response regulator transcription factor [Rhodocyclaceae bacterium]